MESLCTLPNVEETIGKEDYGKRNEKTPTTTESMDQKCKAGLS